MLTGSKRSGRVVAASLLLLATAAAAAAQTITTPKQQFGFNIGDDYLLANYTQFVDYWQKLDSESDRMKVRRDRQDRRGPRPADGDHHVAREPQEARPLQGDLAPAGAGRGPHRRAGAARWRRKARRWSGSTAACTPPKSLGAQQLIETVYQLVEPDRRGDDAHPRRRRSSSSCTPIPTAWSSSSDWYMREAEPEAALDRRPAAALPEVHRPRQQPRLLHVEPAGDRRT